MRDGSWQIQRFKGLGEMMPAQLWDTTMNPDTRRLLPVRIDVLDLARTATKFTMLMGKGEASSRRAWLEEHGNEAEADI